MRDTDKSVMQTTENGQGLVLASWEVAAAAKLYGEGYGVTLAHLSESFTRTVPALKAHERTERFSTGKVGCYYATTKIRKLSGSATVDISGSYVYMNPRSGEYHVLFPSILVSASGTDSVDAVVKGTCNNPYNKDVHERSAASMKLSGEGPGEQGVGRIDPNNPDVLSGSDTVTFKTTKGVRTATITWNLRRCQDQ